jgi:hypothetical protein
MRDSVGSDFSSARPNPLRLSDKQHYDNLVGLMASLVLGRLSCAIQLVIFAIQLVSIRIQALFDIDLVSRTLSTP